MMIIILCQVNEKKLESENITKDFFIGHEVEIFIESNKSDNKSAENKDLTNLSPSVPCPAQCLGRGQSFASCAVAHMELWKF